MKNIISERRSFLKKAGLLTLGVSSVPSSLFKLNLLNAAVNTNAQTGNYKALVCFYQSGGNDSFNMLVPNSNAAYNEYSQTRTNLALDRDSLLSLNGSFNGTSYGVHEDISGIRNLFNDGKLAFVNNIGSLIAPMTKEAYQNGSTPKPLGIFSHSDMTNQWHIGDSSVRGNIGWGGRVADMLHEMNINDNISMNISLSGTNVFESGEQTLNFTIDEEDIIDGIHGYTAEWGTYPSRRRFIDTMLSYNYDNAYEKNYNSIVKRSLDAQLYLKEIVDAVPEFNTEFTDNRISNSFKAIAKVIAARNELGFSRQIFYVDYGGWDMHANLIDSHGDNLSVVSRAMEEFSNVLSEMGVFDDVTTFTMSEFGRTLTSNGDGSDHAWGGNVMVMGGAVNGGQMFGEYPSLELDNPLDLGRGRMIPTTSTDEYFAELALWFGVPSTELVNLFPNLGNFYSASGGGKPIGFLNY